MADVTAVQLESSSAVWHKVPGTGGKELCVSAYVSVAEIVAAAWVDEWMAVNPRVPSRSGAKLTGAVVRGIFDTLARSPELFALKNQGLYLLVDNFTIDASGGKITLRLSDKKLHGLCNGGHTYAAIREYAASSLNPSALKHAFVRVHIFTGVNAKSVVEIAEGLNRSKQVDEASLQNLRGIYAPVREALAGCPGAEEIKYKQGDSGAYDIAEILRVVETFNGERYNSERHPSNLYRQKKPVLRFFESDYRSRPSPARLVLTRLPELLKLMDVIAKEVPTAADAINFKFGSMQYGTSRCGSPGFKGTPLYFLGTTMDYKVPGGWVYVLMSALRANVNWNLGRKRFNWIIPNDQLLPVVMPRLLDICVQDYRGNKQSPDDTARNPLIHKQCYDIVAKHVVKLRNAKKYAKAK